jgi:outer membrane protein
MTFRNIGLASVAMTVAATLATQAGAQSSPMMLTGPTPAGVCSFNGARAVSDSTVGHYVTQRLNELTTQVRAELDAEQSGIQTDGAALEGQKASLSPAQFQTRGEALQARAVALQHKAQQREQEMQATQRKAVQTIEIALGPIVQQTATERHCTLLLSTDSLILPNPSIDITDSALASLNVKLTQFPVDRVHLDQGAQGGQ